MVQPETDNQPFNNEKRYKRLEFETVVSKHGHSGRITLPRSLIGKRVHVMIEVV
jgi:hypothetical protein